MLFVSLLVLVRLIFQHAHLTWPKYTLREFGETFPFATYWSINPAMIIVLTPLVTALTRNRSAFGTILMGAFVSTASVFFMASSTSVSASVWFVVTLSIGEALWSPRLYEYTTVMAPRGREASYMGLSQVPMFIAKPIVGFLSGAMLTAYCPPAGPRNSQTMWLLIGAMTLVGPVLIYLLRDVIQPKGEGVTRPAAG
jgi:dipeptide/tripeptide permease